MMNDAATMPTIVVISDTDAGCTQAFLDALAGLEKKRLVLASLPIFQAEPNRTTFAAIPHAPDARVEEAVTSVFDFAVADGGRLDAIVLTMDGTGTSPALMECSLSDWRQQFEARLRRVFLIVRRAIQEMVDSGTGGSVVLVAPTDSDVGNAIESAAGESLRALTRSLAKEYGRRQIRTNLIESNTPNRAANLAAWLVSLRASFVNGDILQTEAHRE
jgi:NAD(P)-dependent dehydrogenase (short-subunit alcohol dehydrogenase family)